MCANRSLAFGVATVCSVIGLFGLSASAQTSSGPGPINPPVAKCNMTPDTNPQNPKEPYPITDKLLTSGQPCEPVVSIEGLLPNDPLGNLQRGFDFYSWLTFIALNSPADGKTIGHGSGPGGDAPTEWESLKNYRPLADVMLPGGAKPSWGTRIVPDACKRLDGPGKVILQVTEEAWNQPFKTGPLIDQDGNYALFDILMNEPMFDFILDNGLYSKQGQQKFNEQVDFPEGVNPDDKKQPPSPGLMGAIMLKTSWRVIDPGKDKDLAARFHTADTLIYFPGPPYTKAGPTCIEKTLGLVGFHVGHKTKDSPQWVWSTFEQVDNVPDDANVAADRLSPHYNFFNAACWNCPRNQTPPQPWDPPATLHFPTDFRSQVVRVNSLPPEVTDEVADLNRQFRAILKGTVWENYELITTQWPTDAKSRVDPTGAPAPTYLANTTLETYSQGSVPLASSSCMACHGNATTQHDPATASDFTFILEKAR